MPQIYDLHVLFGNHCIPQQHENLVMKQQILGKGVSSVTADPLYITRGTNGKVRGGFAEKLALLEF